MSVRTDLATERCRAEQPSHIEKSNLGKIEIERLFVKENGDLPKGGYVTLTCDGFTPEGVGELSGVIASELSRLVGKTESVLVVGLGNSDITPDSFGPMTANGVIATRHIFTRAAEFGLSGLKSVAVLATGVLGQTGVEAAELAKAAVSHIKPDAVIVIDALAAGSVKRLGKTVQLTDVGICPGSGVGNARKEISRFTLGVPTVAIGVPTVVDAAAFAEGDCNSTSGENACGMMVTPRDIDSMVANAAKSVSLGINRALHPTVDSEILLALSS